MCAGKAVCTGEILKCTWLVCACVLSPGAGEADGLWRPWSRDSVQVPPPCRCSVRRHLELSCTPATPPLAGWSACSHKGVVRKKKRKKKSHAYSQRPWIQPRVRAMSQSWNCKALVYSWQLHYSVLVLSTHLTINSACFPGWRKFLTSSLRDQFHYWKSHWGMQINLICGSFSPSLLHRICSTVLGYEA